ncbi:MAG: hypothetical protein ACFFAS_08010 [Promethearchaeota archaeon]
MIIISRYTSEISPIRHLKALLFNRQASTNGEKKALNYIQNELANGNINNRTEEFKWRDMDYFKPLIALLNIFVIILFLISYICNFWILRILVGFFLLITSILFFHDSGKTSIPIGKEKKSRNIIGEIRAKKKVFKRPLFLFITNYESTRRTLPFLFEILVKFSILLLSLLYMIFFLFISLFNSAILLYYVLEIVLVLIVICTELLISVLLFNNDNDNSDIYPNNSFGVAILLEIAKILRKDALKNFDVVFLWSGAKKYGLWGLKNFFRRHFFNFYKEYDLDNSYCLCIDNIGARLEVVENTGILKRNKILSDLNDIFRATAKNLNISVVKSSLPTLRQSNQAVIELYEKKTKKKIQTSIFTTSEKSNRVVKNNLKLFNDYNDKLTNYVLLSLSVLHSLDMRINGI